MILLKRLQHYADSAYFWSMTGYTEKLDICFSSPEEARETRAHLEDLGYNIKVSHSSNNIVTLTLRENLKYGIN